VRKRQRRFEGFDEKILALYSRGMSTRDIEAHLRELYGVSVGRDLISRVTDAVMDDVREWQQRTLDDGYPVLFLDCMMVKIRQRLGAAPGVLPHAGDRDGRRARRARDVVPGGRGRQVLDAGPHRGDRGVRDILICCVDGLEGFPEAIFPKTTVQTCILHLIRASLRYVPRRDYDAVIKDLRPIYTAIDADRALHALDAFEAKWGRKLPPVVKAWEHLIPSLEFPPEVRRVIYTTNAIEALQPATTKGVQDQGPLSHRGRGPQAHLPRHPQRRAAVDPTPRLDESAAAFKIHFGDRLPS
jgi:transposase-like protein